jgi:uncharacterized protein (DUF362 family)
MAGKVICEIFIGYQETVARCLELARIEKLLSDGQPVMLKPNLVNDSAFPVTTPPDFCKAVILTMRRYTTAPIVIAEGSGDAQLETTEIFSRLGYTSLAQELDVQLMDLNHEPLRKMKNKDCSVFKEMRLPEAVFHHILISLPVLKAHSLCDLTGSMKNMIGIAPPEHYSGRHGTWKKAVFHNRMNRSIVDLNRYRTPDFTIMDATVGLADYHLGGRHCDPPVNRILAGFDARAVDRTAAGLLGLSWQGISYLNRD